MGRNGCLYECDLEVVWNNPQSHLYFNKSHIIPQKAALGAYLGNQKKTMGWIKVERLRNLMKDRNIDVAVVDVPFIFKSIQYKR
jgi:hypothetical protein